MVSSVLALLSSLAGAAIVPGAPATERLTAIDRFCDQLRPLTKKTQGRLFGLLDAPRAHEATWREYTDPDVLKQLVDDLEVFDVANVWTRDDGATALSWTASTPSGDWMQFVDMCYRVDGSLARSSATYNTFDVADDTSQGASRKRTQYFDAAGHLLKTRERVSDLLTKQPAPHLRFRSLDDPIYKRVRDLPFSSLLRSVK